MHTSGLRRCTPGLRLILWRGNILRLRCLVARGTVTLRAWSVATPLAEGSVRVRGQVGLRTPAPDPWGRYRTSDPYAGRRYERRFEAAEHPFSDRIGRAACSGGVRDRSRAERHPGDGHRGRVPIRFHRISRMNGKGR